MSGLRVAVLLGGAPMSMGDGAVLISSCGEGVRRRCVESGRVGSVRLLVVRPGWVRIVGGSVVGTVQSVSRPPARPTDRLLRASRPLAYAWQSLLLEFGAGLLKWWRGRLGGVEGRGLQAPIVGLHSSRWSSGLNAGAN